MTLTIKTPTTTYPIYIDQQLLSHTVFLRSLPKNHQVFIVTDETVGPLYLQYLCAAFSEHQCDTLIIPAGEAQKTLKTFERIIDELIQKQHHRDTTLIALGGGVIGDITGFVAASYLRGVSYIQIPTTLLAQVDSSIGGKTAINHTLGKNLIGAFYHPTHVVIDINTLTTLPERAFRGGFAEIVKAALIYDQDFFAWLESHVDKLLTREEDALTYAITRSCEIKSIFVAADERDHNQRQHLNFGHTIGHALEQVLGFGQWLHGETVTLGMLIASQLSVSMGTLSPLDYTKIFNLLKRLRLIKNCPKNINLYDLTRAMQSDKKIKNNQIQFILLDKIGHSIVTNKIDTAMLESAWQNVNSQISAEKNHAGSIASQTIFSISQTNDASSRKSE